MASNQLNSIVSPQAAAATDLFYTQQLDNVNVGGGAKQFWNIGTDMPAGKYMLTATFCNDGRDQSDYDSSEFNFYRTSGSGTVNTGYYSQIEQNINGGTQNNHLNGTIVAYANLTTTGRVGLYFNPIFDGMSDTDAGGWGGDVSIMIFSLD
jgi:hypothetical protein